MFNVTLYGLVALLVTLAALFGAIALNYAAECLHTRIWHVEETPRGTVCRAWGAQAKPTSWTPAIAALVPACLAFYGCVVVLSHLRH